MANLVDLVAARRAILAINANIGEVATPAQIRLHDVATGARIHHRVRVVTIQALIADIDGLIEFIRAQDRKRAAESKKDDPGAGGGGGGGKAVRMPAAKPVRAVKAK